jgi:hypothetical protein
MNNLTKATVLQVLYLYPQCSKDDWGIGGELGVEADVVYESIKLIEDLSEKDLFLTPDSVTPNEGGGIDFILKTHDNNEISFLYIEHSKDYWFYFFDNSVQCYTYSDPAYMDSGELNPKVLTFLLKSIIVN